MRIGILDAGSNTVQLAVVDGHRGGHLLPVAAYKQRLQLSQRTDDEGTIDRKGIRSLIECVRRAATEAHRHRVDELYALGTAAIRDARNAYEVLRHIREETGIAMALLAAEDEARLTFLAARRWFGWSAGPLLLLDIGGGSTEVAWGSAESASFAVSLPLGAGRLTREWLTEDPPDRAVVERLSQHVKEHVGALTDQLPSDVETARSVGASRTFQQLARLCGAPRARDGQFAPRRLRLQDLRGWIPKLARIPVEDRAKLPGISRTRAAQSLAGAIVAHRLMRALDIDAIDVCPWTLREGIVLNRLEQRGTDSR